MDDVAAIFKEGLKAVKGDKAEKPDDGSATTKRAKDLAIEQFERQMPRPK